MSRFRRFVPAVAAVAVMAGGLSAAAPVRAADALTDAQKAEVRDLVRSYILENPDIVMEAIGILQAREEQQAAAQQGKMIAANADALFKAPGDPVMGNPNGDVTLVEFFDYQCGYCKRVYEPLIQTVNADGKVRLVMKELPILGPASVMAARYALAAKMQGKYQPFHAGMMANKAPVTEETVKQVAREAGLDMGRLETDAQSDAVAEVLRDTMKLASTLGIRGTPAFVVGDTLIPGAAPAEQIAAAIADARAAAKPK